MLSGTSTRLAKSKEIIRVEMRPTAMPVMNEATMIEVAS